MQDTGNRLDRVLAAHVAELSRSRLKALIEAGAVAVGGTHDPRSKLPRQFRRGHHARRAAARTGQARAGRRSRSRSSMRTMTSSSSTSRPAWSCIRPAPASQTGTLVNALIAHCGASLSGIGGESPAGYRAPARQGHDRADGGWRRTNSGASRARRPIRQPWPRRRRVRARRSRLRVGRRPSGPHSATIRSLRSHRSPHARDHMAIREGGRVGRHPSAGPRAVCWWRRAPA